MSSYNPRNRYLHRSRQRNRKVFMFLFYSGCIIAAGFFAGRVYTSSESGIYQQRLDLITQERNDIQSDLIDLRAQLQTLQIRYDDLEQAYDHSLEGPTEELVNLVNEQIDDGMEPAELEEIISKAGSPRQCSEPEMKRFVASTPAFTGPESEVSVADGIITIKASGISARNESGQPEAWYDPAKKVQVRFIHADGKEEVKEGVMPINHVIKVNKMKYRFQIESGAKSFIKVTYDSCDLP